MQKGKIFLALLIVLASGCVTQRKCERKFPVKADTVKVVTVRDSIVYRDTVIFIRLPGEKITDSIQIPCPPPKAAYVPDTAYAETSLARAKAWWKFPYIRLQLVQKDTTIERRLDNAIKEAYHWRTEYEKITLEKKEKYVPKIYKDALTICIILFIAFCAWLGLKISKVFRR